MTPDQGLHPETRRWQGMPEIESRFLVTRLPVNLIQQIKMGTLPYLDLTQGYLNDGKGDRIRCATRNDGITSFVMARKVQATLFVPPQGISDKIEYYSDLTQEEFDGFWPQTVDFRVAKRRYLINGEIEKGLTIELDVFSGDVGDERIDGYMLAEVEFPSLAMATGFKPPDWFGGNFTELITSRKLAKRKLSPIRYLQSSANLNK